MANDDEVVFNTEPDADDKNIYRATHGYWIRREKVRRADRPAFAVVSAWHNHSRIDLCGDGDYARELCREHHQASTG